MSDLDAYRCARQMIDHHGLNAGPKAEIMAELMADADDEPAWRAWMHVVAAIDGLLRTTRRAGEPLH